MAGGPFFYSNYREGGGGVSEEDAREGEGRQGECLWGGGGGLNIFFRGRNAHQVKLRGKSGNKHPNRHFKT